MIWQLITKFNCLSYDKENISGLLNRFLEWNSWFLTFIFFRQTIKSLFLFVFDANNVLHKENYLTDKENINNNQIIIIKQTKKGMKDNN